MNNQEALRQLVAMSCALGQPEKDYVILGEGNTSARVGESSYFVKASGFQLNGIGPEGFVEVCFEPILAMLTREDWDAAAIERQFEEAKMDPTVRVKPSIESVMHAVILKLTGAAFVGHTHPTAVNSILCAQNGAEVLKGRLFPDHVVFCGTAPAYVPYIEPGLPLARQVKEALEAHLDHYGETPKTIFLQNHGLVALGKTASEVEGITAMCVKAARVLLATAAFGGPHFLSEEQVARIHAHPSERYRRKQAGF